MSKRSFASHSIIAVLVLVMAFGALGMTAAQDQQATPYLGIGLQAADNGVEVKEIVPNSPADTAGLEVGDIITQIDNKDVTADSIQSILQDYAVGDSVTLNIVRGDETLELNATLGTRSDQSEIQQFQIIGRPLLGVQLENTDDGVVIREVRPDSAAEKAGLQVGDVLIKIGDTEITEAQDAVEAVHSLDSGDSVEIQVTRDGETLTVTATLEELPLEFNFEGIPFDFSQITGQGRLGVEFVTLNAQVAEERNVEQTEGALVTNVSTDSAAEKAGLQVDDIIVAVNGKLVNEEHTLRDRLVAYEAGDTVTLEVQRGSETLQLEATLDEPSMGDMMPMMPFFNGQPGHQFFGPDGFQLPIQPDAQPIQPNI